MGAAAITSADEGRAGGGDAAQRFRRIAKPGDARGISGGAGDHEIIEHHVPPRPAETIRDKAFFRGAIMHKDHIRITTPPDIQGLAGAQSHHPHGNACFTREDRQDMAEQSGLFRAGGGSDRNAAFLRQGWD
jgi:hypothetical protein